MGALTIASAHPHGIDATTVQQLTSFAELIEVSVGNTEEWDALAHQAVTDELTGLPNRRAFRQHLQLELERVERAGGPLSVAVLDVDHFKSVNDTCGHPTGDHVLVDLSDCLRECSRHGEMVARLGGEEFGWVMPATSGEEALAFAEPTWTSWQQRTRPSTEPSTTGGIGYGASLSSRAQDT